MLELDAAEEAVVELVDEEAGWLAAELLADGEAAPRLEAAGCEEEVAVADCMCSLTQAGSGYL